MKLVIPGKPHAKARPRLSKKTGAVYTPKPTVSFENTVRAIAAQTFVEPMSGPVKLSVWAYFQMPKSWSKAKKAKHFQNWHTQLPDLDNIIKGVSDGLSRIAYVDDKQIAEYGECGKWWTDEQPYTAVWVEPL